MNATARSSRHTNVPGQLAVDDAGEDGRHAATLESTSWAPGSSGGGSLRRSRSTHGIAHDPQPVHAAAAGVPAVVPVPACSDATTGRPRPGCSAASGRRTGSTATSPAASARSASSARSSTRRSTACCSSSRSIGIIIDGAAPLWFCWAIVIREVFVGAMMAVATLVFHMPRFDVSWWGKLATFLLMFAVPGFLLGASDFPGHAGFQVAAWIVGDPRSCTLMGHRRGLCATGPRRHRRRPGQQVSTSPFDTLEHHERSRSVAVLLGSRVAQPRRFPGRASGSPTTPRTPSATSSSSSSRRSANRSPPATRSARWRARSRSRTSTRRCRARSSPSTTPSSIPPTAQRGSLRRGLDLRDRARPTPPSSTTCSTPPRTAG